MTATGLRPIDGAGVSGSGGVATAAGRGARWGHSLIEIMVAVAVVGVLTSFGVPRFTRSLEQSRVDVAAANLRAIWMAQRLFWLKHQTYAEGLAGLVSDPADGENFLDPSLVPASGSSSSNAPDYECQVTAAGATDFTATASRGGSTSWSGSLSIGSDGTVTGSIQSPGGTVYRPSTSFQ
jgi:prepilin-type N-terminal cleavage/methylation domain-containing protein